ncbi:MAG: hypothetical protein BWX80_03804 [Candidatus Hydrogenedentes bacterium ADurb.Bin101]|nr:MAG: hypothetical protein BWX80_03804 [Candidatus Hydrogenedentes bacterium ADurb.Bin101]
MVQQDLLPRRQQMLIKTKMAVETVEMRQAGNLLQFHLVRPAVLRLRRKTVGCAVSGTVFKGDDRIPAGGIAGNGVAPVNDKANPVPRVYLKGQRGFQPFGIIRFKFLLPDNFGVVADAHAHAVAAVRVGLADPPR